jgi:DnaJ family protein C protein 17
VLKYHPDKQTTKPTAASLQKFHEIQVGYELLKDPEGRKALDVVLGAQARAAQRKAALSSHRQKLQQDLERREQEAENRAEVAHNRRKLQEHMERIRRENLQRMQDSGSAKLKREREQEAPAPAPVKAVKTSNLVPYSQQFASLEEFEAYAFKKLMD